MKIWNWRLSGVATAFIAQSVAEAYRLILDRLDDRELAKIARARADEKGVPVDIDSL